MICRRAADLLRQAQETASLQQVKARVELSSFVSQAFREQVVYTSLRRGLRCDYVASADLKKIPANARIIDNTAHGTDCSD
jgi:hypothetical protein